MISPTNSMQTHTNKHETLINAGKQIEQVIVRDQDYPDLANLLMGPPSETYIQPLLDPKDDFLQTHQVALPQTILNRINELHLQCRYFYGVLPEIGRAWISIDHCLYLWNYNDQSDFYEYSDQDQVIVSVGIAKPKPGVFGDQVKYVLVVSTPLQIILLAVSIDQPRAGSNSLTLYGTNITVPADDSKMIMTKGTEDGRIFLISLDGHLYELDYTHPDSWFTKTSELICRTKPAYSKYLPTVAQNIFKTNADSKVVDMAIDNERKVLYLLFDSNSIQVIYLGDPYDKYKPIFKHSSITDNAIQMCRQQSRIFDPSDFKLESIHVISKAESKRIHLMAVTNSGFRLYFTHHRDAFRTLSMPSINTSAEPNTLELGHIRIPPPKPTRSAGEFPSLYTLNYYDCGIWLSVNPKTDEVDTIQATAVAAEKPTINNSNTNLSSMMVGGIRPTFLETLDAFDFNDTVKCLLETNPELHGKHYIKEVSQQLTDPPRQFMIMTSRSLHFYNKLRPVDILHRAISNTTSEVDAKIIHSFFERYGLTESCAICLSVICASDEDQVVSKATKIFFECGGVPTSAYSSQVTGNYLGRATGQTDVTYSGKHDGFILYFSRIIAPIWKSKVFADRGNDISAQIAYAQIQQELYNTKVKLEKLKDFMDTNSHFHKPANISDPRFQAENPAVVSLELAEQKSVHELYLLLVQCIEAIYFISFLLDSNAQSIISENIGTEEQNEIRQLDLNTILTTLEGRELIRELVIGTISKYGSNNTHTGFDVVSKQLEKYCKSFFGSSDISFFKGVEYLRRALYDETKDERAQSLKHSLVHFKAAADEISETKMAAVCAVYVQCSFHYGIIELALERAKKQDPQQQGVLAYESPQSRDETNRSLMMARLNTYRFIFEALTDAHKIKQQGVPANRFPIDDVDSYVKNLFELTIQNNDKLLHYQLYDWFMQQNLKDQLLTINTPYLIPYFQEHVHDKAVSLDFLWKYYRQNDRPYDAALCLETLAKLPSASINLDDRLGCLVQALVNARCAESINVHGSVYIQNLENKVQWAQYQLRVRDILRSLGSNEANMAVNELNQTLFDPQTIEEKYGHLCALRF